MDFFTPPSNHLFFESYDLETDNTYKQFICTYDPSLGLFNYRQGHGKNPVVHRGDIDATASRGYLLPGIWLPNRDGHGTSDIRDAGILARSNPTD